MSTDSLPIVDDGLSGIVRVTVGGSWSPQECSLHFSSLAGTLARYRFREAQVRVLVDLRAGDEQRTETRDRTEQWLQRICRPGDRLALLVRSSLHKAQLRPLPIDARREIFASEAAACDWVLA